MIFNEALDELERLGWTCYRAVEQPRTFTYRVIQGLDGPAPQSAATPNQQTTGAYIDKIIREQRQREADAAEWSCCFG